MRASIIILAAGLLTSVSATADPYAWSPALASYYDVVAKHVQEARQAGVQSPPTCDLSKVKLPVAPTPLPTPDGLTLEHVALGRGIQNYTCANSTSQATPAAIGAVASLWNASCLAANYPDVLAMIPNIALSMPNPPNTHPGSSTPGPAGAAAPPPTLQPSNIQLSGHHFFSTNTTAVFELDSATATDSHMGIIVSKKVANSTAPSGSPQGANGAVAWLYLAATNTSQTVDNKGLVRIGVDQNGDDWKAVYRLQTAGGAAPKTCDGLPVGQVLSYDYSAVYYFFKGSGGN